jgi:hypothetical protein
LSTSLRYDRDHRKNTTETPAEFIPAPLVGTAFPGQVREHTWDDWQPKVTLRHKPTRDSTLYVGYSRGFRSGGFNQTGVGAAGIAGVNDLFDAETADTYEGGAKAEFLDRRVGANVSIFHTQAKGSYFFVFDPNTSTQNLGNLDRVNYTGAEFEVRGRILDGFDGYVGLGFTDSDIKESRRAASDVGNEAPLVSRYTTNVGLQYRHVLRSGLSAFVRSDIEVIGPTWFYPDNFTERDPVTLLNVRLGVDGKSWSATVWAKNLTDTNIQRGVVARTDVLPESGLHQQFRFQGNAATLGRRSELSILSWLWRVRLLLELRRHVLAGLLLKRDVRQIHDVVALVWRRQVHRIRHGVVAPQRELLRIKRESLDDMHLLAAARGGRQHARGKPHRVDDERIAFPAAD